MKKNLNVWVKIPHGNDALSRVWNYLTAGGEVTDSEFTILWTSETSQGRCWHPAWRNGVWQGGSKAGCLATPDVVVCASRDVDEVVNATPWAKIVVIGEPTTSGSETVCLLPEARMQDIARAVVAAVGNSVS